MCFILAQPVKISPTRKAAAGCDAPRENLTADGKIRYADRLTRLVGTTSRRYTLAHKLFNHGQTLRNP